MFSAEPDLSEFVVEDYDPLAPPAPTASVPHSSTRGDVRSADGGVGGSGLTAAQQARKERIAAARAAAFGGADDGHFDRQERQRHSSDSGHYARQPNASDKGLSGQVCVRRYASLQMRMLLLSAL